MPHFQASDSISLWYEEVGSVKNPPLILLHGFTGSSAVWQRNIPALSQGYRVIAPDLRGHGVSDKPSAGYHVSRLAMDLRNLIDHLNLPKGEINAVAGSLGCAILWSYAELLTASDFAYVVLVDQAPLQNYTSDGVWGPEHGNRSCNSAAALAHIQATLKYSPDDVYEGTIASCLAYLSHPQLGDNVSLPTQLADRHFFLEIARVGKPEWFGKLMADHTSLDWRDSIAQNFHPQRRVLVIASSRSGCFPAAGPLYVAGLINSSMGHAEKDNNKAIGITVDWGGHWCYWENPEKFNDLVLTFLMGSDPNKERTMHGIDR